MYIWIMVDTLISTVAFTPNWKRFLKTAFGCVSVSKPIGYQDHLEGESPNGVATTQGKEGTPSFLF